MRRKRRSLPRSLRRASSPRVQSEATGMSAPESSPNLRYHLHCGCGASGVQLHHQPVLDAHARHLHEHVGREPDGVLTARRSW